MHVTHPVPQLPDDVKWLQSLIDRLMAKDAAVRYPTGEAFAAAVDQLLASAPEARLLGETGGRRRAAPRLSRTEQQRQVATAGETSARARPAWLLPSAGALALLLALGGWFALRGGQGAAPAPPGQARVEPAPAPAAFESRPAEVPVTDLAGGAGAAQDVATLVATAEQYVRTGIVERGRRLASPPGDNAIDLYLRALQLEPGNPQAEAGLQRIADFFESKSKDAFDRGIYASSLVLAEEGLRAKPGDERLAKLVGESRRALGQ
jgi:hypothetical protein